MNMEVWDKSNTKTSSALKLKTHRVSTFYQNSYKWEKLKIQFKLPVNIGTYATNIISARSPNSQFFIDDATLRYAG